MCVELQACLYKPVCYAHTSMSKPWLKHFINKSKHHQTPCDQISQVSVMDITNHNNEQLLLNFSN